MGVVGLVWLRSVAELGGVGGHASKGCQRERTVFERKEREFGGLVDEIGREGAVGHDFLRSVAELGGVGGQMVATAVFWSPVLARGTELGRNLRSVWIRAPRGSVTAVGGPGVGADRGGPFGMGRDSRLDRSGFTEGPCLLCDNY